MRSFFLSIVFLALSACTFADDRASVDATCEFYSGVAGMYFGFRLMDVPLTNFLPEENEMKRQVIMMAYEEPVDPNVTYIKPVVVDFQNKVALFCHRKGWRDILPPKPPTNLVVSPT